MTHVYRIMMLLSKEKLQKLEHFWLDYPDGVGPVTFVELILDTIECETEDQ
jgi:5,10-methylene-tetrahydrofolate dehydrogenase/methenyl tetrahydrofolate cyclohydrolase